MKRLSGFARPAAVAMLIAASTTVPTPIVPDITPPADGEVVLAPGEDADVAPATKLRFERIVSDSRCPAGVQCVWAGEVRIGLVLTSPAGTDSFELSEAENKATVHSLQIEFLSFGACPANKPAAVLGKECAKLKVTASAAP
jgi:hypothetical protein